MARVWKLLRSRFFLGAVCIVLEFVQLLTVYMLLYRLFHPLTIAAWVFSIGVLLYLINKDESAETKIPWLMILLLLPVMGAFVYMLLSSNETSRKQYERFAENGREILPFLPQTEDVEHLAGNDADALSQIRYIYSAAKMPCHGTSATAYFPSGEAFLPALLDDLRAAERFILLEYFIIQEGRMWNAVHEILRQKAAEGVKVCLMYDDFGCIATLPDNYDRQLRAEGISCTVSNRFRPILSHIHNNRDHRKITVIDGRVGYTGGLNLADEYINAVEKHGHWKDTAVRVEGAAARNLTALFLSVWNAQSDDKLDAAACLGDVYKRQVFGGLDAPAQAHHLLVEHADALRAQAQLGNHVLLLRHALFVLHLVFQAGPEIHGDGANLHLHGQLALLVGKEHRNAHNQVQAAIAVGLGALDVVLAGDQLHVVLAQKRLRKLVDIVHIGTDDAYALSLIHIYTGSPSPSSSPFCRGWRR